MSYNVNDKGYYGEFGGAYHPGNVISKCRRTTTELPQSHDPTRLFRKNSINYLKDYVGRPSPLYISPNVFPKNTTLRST